MTEREAREKAAIRIMIEGIPSSPGGVGPVIRLLNKRRLIKAKWKQRQASRASTKKKPEDPPAA